MASMKHSSSTRTDCDALIVGAGLAGLYAGYLLGRSNISYAILEADDRPGGRVYSRPEASSTLGLTLDEGANLINSTDMLAIRLMNNASISYVRRLSPRAESMHYFVGGVGYSQAEADALLFAESPAAIAQFAADQQIWRDDRDRDINPKFTDDSIIAYLAKIEAGPVFTRLLASFFWSEYGHGLAELNLLVLFDYLDIDIARRTFHLIPKADEAYTVPGGTGQISQLLAMANAERINYGRRVVSIHEGENCIEVRHAGKDGTVTTSLARHVFFAAPLHALRHIDVDVEGISQQSLEMARRATYASGTKLHMKFYEGFHKRYRFTGILLTETGEQIWPSSIGQGGAGLLTVLTGPLERDGQDGAEERAQHILRILDTLDHGISSLFAGVERSDAPLSYSGALKPGEKAQLSIHDGGNRWTTIGEASGGELQGYLEGALRSADHGLAEFLIRRRWATGHRKRMLTRARQMMEDEGFDWAGVDT